MPDRLADLPDDARCWVFAAERPLTEDEQHAVLDHLDRFFDGWRSHGRPVEGAAAMHEGRFLVVGGLRDDAGISGCGIDAVVREIEAAAGALGAGWLTPLLVFWRGADGAIQHGPRGTFRRLVRQGAVTAETSVFDLSLTTLGELRRHGLERPAGRSWHARVFRIPEGTASR